MSLVNLAAKASQAILALPVTTTVAVAKGLSGSSVFDANLIRKNPRESVEKISHEVRDAGVILACSSVMSAVVTGFTAGSGLDVTGSASSAAFAAAASFVYVAAVNAKQIARDMVQELVGSEDHSPTKRGATRIRVFDESGMKKVMQDSLLPVGNNSSLLNDEKVREFQAEFKALREISLQDKIDSAKTKEFSRAEFEKKVVDEESSLSSVM